MRKTVVLLFALVLFLSAQIGSAFADSRMDDEISKLIGIKYKYAGTTTSGFDCSGFTMYVFKKLGIELPHASKSQAKLGKKVSRDELRPGDLLFFNTSGKGVSHVGIYIGDGSFAHSHSSGVSITKLSDKYYAKRYMFARRVMDTETYQAVATELDDAADAPATSADEAGEEAPDESAAQ